MRNELAENGNLYIAESGNMRLPKAATRHCRMWQSKLPHVASTNREEVWYRRDAIARDAVNISNMEVCNAVA